MQILTSLFNSVLYQPLFNILVLLYLYLPGSDFGVAVVVLTLIIKFLLYPLNKKAIKSQQELAVIQPLIKEAQDKYKNDKEKQVKEVMDIYKTHKVNPFLGIVPMLIQIPVLLALFWLFSNGLKMEQMSWLYGFVHRPDSFNLTFLRIVDLSKPDVVISFLAGISQFFQLKIGMPKTKKSKDAKKDIASGMQRKMQYFFPVMTFVILLKLPAAVGLYWLVSNIFSTVQQYKLSLRKEKNA